MKRDDFLDRLNARSAPRYGVEVNRWKLQDWVKEDYFEGVAGGTHNWTRQSYRAALQVCRLRSRGITSANETRIHLFLHGAPIPVDRLRASVADELQHFAHVLSRQSSTSFDGGMDPSPQTLRGFARQSEKASRSILPDGFSWPAEDLAHWSALARFGEPIGLPGRHSISNFIGTAALGDEVRNSIAQCAELSLAGIFGDPSEIENSALQLIAEAEEDKFIQARRFYRISKWAMKHARRIGEAAPPEIGALFERFEVASGNAAAAVAGKDWAICLFAQFLLMACRVPNGLADIFDLPRGPIST